CSQACYARYESGSREIPLEALIALAKYYRTSVDYILRLTDEIRPYPVARKNMI
ncbi:MAG: helix-turn-helix transcriptional regulator, partial [Agathobacter sp.]|nr:helix-turn-helix transcriptional regulator [Agathobacter sp.]